MQHFELRQLDDHEVGEHVDVVQQNILTRNEIYILLRLENLHHDSTQPYFYKHQLIPIFSMDKNRETFLYDKHHAKNHYVRKSYVIETKYREVVEG